jgi:hypothetical protein
MACFFPCASTGVVAAAVIASGTVSVFPGEGGIVLEQHRISGAWIGPCPGERRQNQLPGEKRRVNDFLQGNFVLSN